MASVNLWIGIGNLCADPELRHTQAGKAVTGLRLACNETWKDKDGQKQERTEFITVNVWGAQAENCCKYLAKGRLVAVQGKLQTRSYEKDGQKHYATDIVADRVTFLGGGERDRDLVSQRPRTDHDSGSQVPPGDDDPDSIPF